MVVVTLGVSLKFENGFFQNQLAKPEEGMKMRVYHLKAPSFSEKLSW